MAIELAKLYIGITAVHRLCCDCVAWTRVGGPVHVRVGAPAANKATAINSCPDGHPDLEVQATPIAGVGYTRLQLLAEDVVVRVDCD